MREEHCESLIGGEEGDDNNGSAGQTMWCGEGDGELWQGRGGGNGN